MEGSAYAPRPIYSYIKAHPLDFFSTGGSKAAIIASSKTFFNPRCSNIRICIMHAMQSTAGLRG